MYTPRRLRVQRQQLKQKILLYGLGIAVVGMILGFIVSFGLFAWYARDLPSPSKLSQNTNYSTIFYDRSGKILYEMYKDKNRVPVTADEVPKYLKEATISIEDKNFYNHGAISETGILRSILSIIFRGQIEGGSTLTQQLIKNVLLDSRRNISRKIKEAILAYEAERKYTKDQILLMYLNEAPYGGIYWGVGTASLAYFGKPVKDLNLVESAILAGLPQSPSQYSPFIGVKDAWKGRTTNVLRRMREDGYITSAQEKAEDISLNSIRFLAPKLPIQAPHFVFYVKDQIEKEYGTKIFDQGLTIKTTLSLDTQNIVQNIVKEEIGKLSAYHATNGAVVVLDSQTGEILAMVGSYDYNDPKFGNYNAAIADRQPGSTVKPITYSLAFKKGYTAATTLLDVKTVFPNQGGKDYTPVNYDGKYHGPTQLRFALGNSINIIAVKLLAMVGIRDFLQQASDMGLTGFAPTDANMNKYGLAVTLGGGDSTLLQMSSAYSIFSNGGIKHDTSAISEIDDFNGKTIYKSVNSNPKRVISPEVSFLISHILSDNNARTMEFGQNSYLNIPGRTVAVKTGTTDDKRDNWAIGYTKNITVGVWVGNNDNSPMNQQIASGETGASPIFYRIMTTLLNPGKDHPQYDDGIMAKPDDVKALTIDAYLGGLPKDGYPTRSEYFIDGTQPKDVSPYYKTLKISKSDGKLANNVQIQTGNYDSKDFIKITEDDPVSTDGQNRWQQAINDWENQQSDSKFHAPTDTSSDNANSVLISFKSPGDKTTVSSGNIDVQAQITSATSLKDLWIYLNGNEIRHYTDDHKDVNEVLSLSDGVYSLKIKAVDKNNNPADSTVQFGVNKPWDATPTQNP